MRLGRDVLGRSILLRLGGVPPGAVRRDQSLVLLVADGDKVLTTPFPAGTCPTVYGPVASRRHGRSLGINLGLEEAKACTWGCLYCQCGVGELRDIRSDEGIPSRASVLAKAESAILACRPLDSVTLAGNSEPTAHPEFREIVGGLLEIRARVGGHWTLNCLSNGSELDSPHVREGCGLLDEAWIKLDCAVEDQFQLLNRPLARLGSLDAHLARVARLDQVCIQTLVWDSPARDALSNWNDANRAALLKAYARLQPKSVHLTTVARLPASRSLTAVPLNELQQFANDIRGIGAQVRVFD